VSLLISVKEAEFTFLKEKTKSTAGNLSVQINKLREAGYIEVVKQFKDNYPQTVCRISAAGVMAFEQYVKALHSYLHVDTDTDMDVDVDVNIDVNRVFSPKSGKKNKSSGGEDLKE
jgi:hypothetical protein